MPPFAPGGERGLAVQQEMSRRLGGSLRHIFERAQVAAGLPDDQIAPLLRLLDAGARAHPEAFGLHSDILQAIAVGDLDAVRADFDELAGRPFTVGSTVVRPFNDATFSPSSKDRYRRYAGSDPDAPLVLTGPTDDEFAAFSSRLDDARDLLARGAPEVADEVNCLVSEIVVATVDDPDPDRVFDGISVFDLWGAVFVNPRRHSTVLEVVEVLVHEAAHSLLFGFCVDEPLVLNPQSERFSSPVRADARPMDGVFHGAYVIAALDYLYRRLSATGALSPDDQAMVTERLSEYGKPFEAGMAVIREHAALTDTGRRIIDSADAHMRATAH
jgi:hypothetical protein